MSRTTKGKLTGRAAATELAEQREYIREMNRKHRKEQIEALKQKEIDLMWDCVDIEGEESFCAWYDDDENVPSFGTYESRIELIKEHLEQLKGK